MAKGGSKKASKNISFKQTAQAFKALRQTRVFSGIKRNIPYKVRQVSQKVINDRVRKIRIKKFQTHPLGKLKKYSNRINPKVLKEKAIKK